MIAAFDLDVLEGQTDKTAARIEAETAAVSAELNTLLRDLDGFPAKVDEITEHAKAGWFLQDVELRERGLELARRLNDFANKLNGVLEITNRRLRPEISKAAGKEIRKSLKALGRFDAQVKANLKIESRRSKEMTERVLSRDPNARAEIQRVREAYATGRFKRFTAEQLMEKARSC